MEGAVKLLVVTISWIMVVR